MTYLRMAGACWLGLSIAACSTTPPATESTEKTVAATAAPFPSTYKAASSPPTLIRNATVLTGTGERLNGADVLFVDGKFQAIGTGLTPPANARVIDASGRWVTPGLIDVHSHLGVYASPGVDAHSDGNEATAPAAANVWAEHGDGRETRDFKRPFRAA